MTGVSTLLSSKVSAAAMCLCSVGGLADEELPRLAVVVGEAFGAQPNLRPFLDIGEDRKPRCGRLPRAFAERVRLVVHAPDRIAHRHMAVLLEMVRTGISAR